MSHRALRVCKPGSKVIAVRNLLLVPSGVWGLKATFGRGGVDEIREKEQGLKGY